jgi:hypothetical protein
LSVAVPPDPASAPDVASARIGHLNGPGARRKENFANFPFFSCAKFLGMLARFGAKVQNSTMSKIKAKVRRGRELTQKWKLSARTAQEIYEWFNTYVAWVKARDDVKFRDRKMSNEAILSAIVLRFKDFTEQERTNLLRACVPRVEALLGDRPEGEAADVPATMPMVAPAPEPPPLARPAVNRIEEPDRPESPPTRTTPNSTEPPPPRRAGKKPGR